MSKESWGLKCTEYDKKRALNSWAKLGINTMIQIKTPSALRIKTLNSPNNVQD